MDHATRELRDRFACAAIQGILALNVGRLNEWSDFLGDDILARQAYKLADQLLAVRDATTKEKSTAQLTVAGALIELLQDIHKVTLEAEGRSVDHPANHQALEHIQRTVEQALAALA